MTEVASKALAAPTEKAVPEVEECVICMDTITKRGQIDSCDHKFCFDCIVKWSKVTNKCPVCKREFRKVSEVVSNTISGKGKRKRAPKVVQVKQKTQRSDVHYYPPQLNSAMAREVDIRDLMRLIFMPAMMGLAHDYDDDDDSDYNEDEDEYDIQPPFRRVRPVPTNETFENGHRVIEILDDEDGNAAVATPIRNAPPPRHHAPSVVAGYPRGHVAPRAQMLPAPRRRGQPAGAHAVAGTVANPRPALDSRRRVRASQAATARAPSTSSAAFSTAEVIDLLSDGDEDTQAQPSRPRVRRTSNHCMSVPEVDADHMPVWTGLASMGSSSSSSSMLQPGFPSSLPNALSVGAAGNSSHHYESDEEWLDSYVARQRLLSADEDEDGKV